MGCSSSKPTTSRLRSKSAHVPWPSTPKNKTKPSKPKKVKTGSGSSSLEITQLWTFEFNQMPLKATTVAIKEGTSRKSKGQNLPSLPFLSSRGIPNLKTTRNSSKTLNKKSPGNRQLLSPAPLGRGLSPLS